MPLIRIKDPDAPELIDYLGLTDVALRSRQEPERGLYMAESASVIARALEAGHRPRSMLMEDKWLEPMAELLAHADAGDGRPVPVYVGDRDLLRQVTGFTVHRGAIAAMQRPVLPTVDDLLSSPAVRRVVVLEDIVDHTNVGAIFRSVAGLGADAVLVTPRCADPLYRRSVRVSMGTVFQVPWTRLPAWPEGIGTLHEHGFTVAALTLTDDAVSLDDFSAPERLAMVLGTEGDGIATPTLAAVDLRVRIPMSGGVDSLNVAAASAVAIWAVR